MADAIPVIFRNLFQNQEPGTGELWIQAAEEHGDCRALALLVCEHGPGALRRGGAEVKQVVVHHDPTLDDLLAAHLVRKQLAGEKLSESYSHFAQYAAMVREGLRPSESIPVEDSLEGVFLFLRNEAGTSLSDPGAGPRFLTAWKRMGERIDKAASDPNFDVFAKSPLTGDPEFGRVRTFLEKDRCNFRDDVRRGQVFRGRLPEIANCPALLLRVPKSLLFRYWFRDDNEAPGGDGYRLLIVDWGEGNWVISTDPRKRISLQVLCQRLQAIEPAPRGGVPGQWFDGRPFRHTLIAAPRSGTRLSEADILKVVRGWAALRPARTQPTNGQFNPNPEGWRRYAQWVAVPVIGALTNFALMKYGGGPSKAASVVAPVVIPAETINRATAPPSVSLPRGESGSAERVSTIPAGSTAEHTFDIPADLRGERSVAVRMILQGAADPLPEISATIDGIPTSPKWDPERVYDSEHWSTDLVLDPLPAEPIKVTLRNPSRSPIRYTLKADWHTDRRTLYILSVGISKYKERPPLPCAAPDARDLEAGLRRRYRGVFTNVESRVRLNGEATKATLLSDFEWLVNNAKPTDLVVVTIAGHGELHSRGEREFYYLLANSNPKEPLGTDDLSWREISRDLNSLKCSAVVIMDCCHSGGILRGGQDAALSEEVQRAIGKVDHLKRGFLYLAACQADETAQENKQKWGHGALTLGLLEYLDGQAKAQAAPPQGLPHNNQVLYLHDWCAYAANRVKDLTSRGQSATMRETENFKSQWLPIGVLEK